MYFSFKSSNPVEWQAACACASPREPRAAFACHGLNWRTAWVRGALHPTRERCTRRGDAMTAVRKGQIPRAMSREEFRDRYY
ncbi:MAG TPA: hypothetical protein VFN64_13230, partial [Burkholderiaceae bacterium]|nr:hypothetical protein [Burkholderiaceae bacterium]